MLYVLAGLNVALIIALVVVVGFLIDHLAVREHAHDTKVSELCVRIQAPDSPQVTMLPGQEPVAGRRLHRTEADEIAEAIKRANELVEQA